MRLRGRPACQRSNGSVDTLVSRYGGSKGISGGTVSCRWSRLLRSRVRSTFMGRRHACEVGLGGKLQFGDGSCSVLGKASFAAKGRYINSSAASRPLLRTLLVNQILCTAIQFISTQYEVHCYRRRHRHSGRLRLCLLYPGQLHCHLLRLPRQRPSWPCHLQELRSRIPRWW